MVEELISFETAKLAKEKGLTLEDCKDIFDTYHIYRTDTHNYCQGNKEYLEIYNDLTFISAPTQSLLQKWLRDIHKIDVVVIPDTQSFSIYSCSIFNQYTENDNHIERKVFVTNLRDENNKIITWMKFENALEYGLQEGIKLIK